MKSHDEDDTRRPKLAAATLRQSIAEKEAAKADEGCCHINMARSQMIYDYPNSSSRCHLLPSLHRRSTKLP